MKFMMKNDACEFFIDEFPISYRRTIKDEIFVNYLEERVKQRPKQFIWITFRLTEVNTDFYSKNMDTVNFYKDSLARFGFKTPSLTLNMRNSSNVIETFESIYGYGKRRLQRR